MNKIAIKRQQKNKTTSTLITDYTDPKYWNGLIKMSLSKFFILAVLSKESMHGYQIAKTVATTTNGRCSPTSGALYPVLREFEQGKYVTLNESTNGGRTRKIYTITKKGRKAFKVASEVWIDIGQLIIENRVSK